MKLLLPRDFPEQLFIAGLVCMPAFALEPDTAVRLAQTALYMGLSLLLGRRIRILPNLILVLAAVAASLMLPHGRILFTLWRLRVTEGALRSGLSRSALLIGLIYLSRLTVRSNVKIPGRPGRLLGRVFHYFEALTELRGRHSGKPLDRLDQILMDVYPTDASHKIPKLEESAGLLHRSNRSGGYPLIAALFVGTWVPYLGVVTGIIPQLWR